MSMRYLNLCGFVRAAIFAALSFMSLGVGASNNDSSLVWNKLLHFDGSVFLIKDEKFYLDGIPASPAEELLRTINLLSSITENSHSFACNFPARFGFVIQIRKDLGQLWTDFSFQDCPKYYEYDQKVKVDSVSLVFAGENIFSPTSMMGHVFLKLSGVDGNGVKREHALSYYAEINSSNPMMLFYDSIFKGMVGRIGLHPYRAKLDEYRNREGRSVWEYTIKSENIERALLKAHIFELSRISPTYFFTEYNCATFIYDLLGVLNPSFSEHIKEHRWVTPRDVVRDFETFSLYSGVVAHLSPQHSMKALRWNVSDDVKAIQGTEQLIKLRKSLLLTDEDVLYLDNLTTFWYLTKKISKEDYESYLKMYSGSQRFIKIKTPTNGSNDSQWSIGLASTNGLVGTRFRWMPASHRLEDGSQAFFTQNQLKLFDLELSISNAYGVRVENLDLYKVESLNAIEPHVKQLSWGWKIGFDRDGYLPAPDKLAFATEFGVGFDIRPFKRLDLFSIMYAGAKTNLEDSALYLRPELGVIWEYEGKYKVVVRASEAFSTAAERLSRVKSTLDFFVFKEWTVQAYIDEKKTKNSSKRETGVNLIHYF